MRILLPTGSGTFGIVREAASGYDADIVVTGEIASFLTPQQLKKLLEGGNYDLALVSGMCTASFEDVEKDTGIPVYRGPKHAADLSLVLPLLEDTELSRTIPADVFLKAQKEKEAYARINKMEENASSDFLLRGIKIGGMSRIKVLAELMDAHKRDDLLSDITRFFASGADIVDLGFGFDTSPDDVKRCFQEIKHLDGPIAIDSQDPELIEASLGRADLILSLHEGNLPEIGRAVARARAAAVILPGERGLAENVETAMNAGIKKIVVDPLLMPVGSGLVPSLCRFQKWNFPVFFGAGNVTELVDADSIGVNALLAGLAHECGSSIIFTSEHSDKTRGSVGEMRRAVEMLYLMGDRPYPKDLGIDLLVLKEKRRRREPPLQYDNAIDALLMPDEIEYDPKGNLRIGIEGGMIVAIHDGVAIRGTRWEDVFYTLLSQERLSLLDHAAYLGKELYKAELALRFGRSFEQDGDF